MAEFETIRVGTDARGVATLTLSRPEKHNALNAQMIAELTNACGILGNDEAVRAVILAAEGKSFCAGGDLNWMRDQVAKDRAGKMEDARALALMLQALNTLPKPLIGRVHGPAYGGGIGMMAVCDFTIVASSAKFALTETRLGLIPATIGPFVVRRMGEGYARQVFFTAKSFGPDFALKSGLASDVVADSDLDTRIEEEIAPILKTKPGALAAAKALSLRLGGEDMLPLIEYTVGALADRWESEEAQAGIEAFLSK